MTKLRTLELQISLAGGIGNRRWATALSWGKVACAAVLLCAATATVAAGQAFKNLATFDISDGANPFAPLVQGANGNFYGTTAGGGDSGSFACLGRPFSGCGTVFEITPVGTLTTLYSFCSQTNCADGESPHAGLIEDPNGNFYGTTQDGGATRGCFYGDGCGTVFEVTPAGTLTTLYSFCSRTICFDGANPNAGLVQATNGNFYGTTTFGGTKGVGTVFAITPAGTLTTLYSFCSQTNCTDGEVPLGGLVQATNGNLYGTTSEGGVPPPGQSNGVGTVFAITPAGTLTTLYSFCSQTNCTDGEDPRGGLVQAPNGNFYGTTSAGGATGNNGTVFEITPVGKLTTLHSFNATDGSGPDAGVVLATDGNFYGTTTQGGAGSCSVGCGTVFAISPAGKLSTLHSFDGGDGSSPDAGVVQATNGIFYGTNFDGGSSASANCNAIQGCGTVFALSVGLGPFVETIPTSGKVGTRVTILGNKLTGAASVTFNGTAATFTVSPTGTAIITRVPNGAATGKVQVTTPSGTLTSNAPFRVIP